MAAANSYTQKYIDGCRSMIGLQVAAYKKMVSTAKKGIEADEKQVRSAFGSFEAMFFNNMLLVLDALFIHRSRALEKKDGNPLNEVRLMTSALAYYNGVMTMEKSIKFDPARSILKYKAGDHIKLTEADFSKLCEAFFTEIENKYLK